MTVSDWIAIGGVAVTIVTGFVAALIRQERRHGTYMTRAEHEKICADRNTRVEKSIDGLRDDMERRHQENRQTQGRIFSRLDSIADRVGANKGSGG